VNASTHPPPSSTWSALTRTARDLVAAAEGVDVVVRVVGSTAIHLHCEAAAQAHERVQRRGKDIDLVVRSRDRKRLRALLERDGYVVDQDLLVAMEGMRFCFTHPTTGIELDVFVDRMEFSHTLDLSRRLELDACAVPLEDLLLQKLQVHDLTRNDLLDAVVLLGTHPVASESDDRELIDAGYVAGLLAHDWGLHHTAVANLERIVRALHGAEGDALGGPQLVAPALTGAELLRAAIDGAAKSRGWRLRARIGERMQWWEDVDEREGAY
jgi:hypothetical protein